MGDQYRWCEFGVLLLLFLLLLYFSVSRCIAGKRRRRTRTFISPPLSRFSASYPSSPGVSSRFSWTADRQGNVFSAEERPNNRYGDIFFIEPGSDEANRIRDQLEKDEKDLPSYDEVMRMCNLTTPTAAAAAGAPVTVPPLQSPLGDPAAPISIAALPAPPYSETDPHSPVAGAATVITMEPIEPSTSRAAQIPTSPASAAAPAAGYQRPETSIVLGANVTSV
ncbi:oleosin-B6 isoform X5 [Drosophila serrata]|uniref:oleosin-B6 isoform X5 n=1 Tax=Drosophila serrata TaxID=7274 RepID=UPI000A1D2045|nr:oleosin-B6 isoform X5 [Drosophila serrata]